MADAPAYLEPIPKRAVRDILVTIDPFVAGRVFEILPTKDAFGGVTGYLQRVYDTGLGAYVYFTRLSTNPANPALAIGDTQPNNTGAFDFTNHAILAELR